MKKIIYLILSMLMILPSCVKPVLNKGEYRVVDTLNVSYNGFNKILGYHVIIEYNDKYHYGYITYDGDLTMVNIKPVKCVE